MSAGMSIFQNYIRMWTINFCARIICNNYDYINTRSIDLVKSLKLQAIREHRDYFLCVDV